MKRFLLISFPLFLWLFVGCTSENARQNTPSDQDAEPPQRVVSLSPAMTEIMYALGLEDRLIGVTIHCKYPPEAQEKTQVGTVFKPNLELLARLKPDRILMNTHYAELEATFRRFGWTPEPIHDERVEDVFASIGHLGRLFQVEDRAEELAAGLKQRLENLREKTKDAPKIRVLLVVSRNYASPRLEDVYVTGHDGLCEPLLEAAGGVNAYTGKSAFPKVSPEGILSMDPDVILEIIPDSVRANVSDEELDRAWKTLPGLRAVQNRKIVRLTESDAALIPGPSMVDWAEKTASLLSKCTDSEE